MDPLPERAGLVASLPSEHARSYIDASLSPTRLCRPDSAAALTPAPQHLSPLTGKPEHVTAVSGGGHQGLAAPAAKATPNATPGRTRRLLEQQLRSAAEILGEDPAALQKILQQRAARLADVDARLPQASFAAHTGRPDAHDNEMLEAVVANDDDVYDDGAEEGTAAGGFPRDEDREMPPTFLSPGGLPDHIRLAALKGRVVPQLALDIVAHTAARQRLHLRLFYEHLDDFVAYDDTTHEEWELLLCLLLVLARRRGGLTVLQRRYHDEVSELCFDLLFRLLAAPEHNPRFPQAVAAMLAILRKLGLRREEDLLGQFSQRPEPGPDPNYTLESVEHVYPHWMPPDEDPSTVDPPCPTAVAEALATTRAANPPSLVTVAAGSSSSSYAATTAPTPVQAAAATVPDILEATAAGTASNDESTAALHERLEAQAAAARSAMTIHPLHFSLASAGDTGGLSEDEFLLLEEWFRGLPLPNATTSTSATPCSLIDTVKYVGNAVKRLLQSSAVAHARGPLFVGRGFVGSRYFTDRTLRQFLHAFPGTALPGTAGGGGVLRSPAGSCTFFQLLAFLFPLCPERVLLRRCNGLMLRDDVAGIAELLDLPIALQTAPAGEQAPTNQADADSVDASAAPPATSATTLGALLLGLHIEHIATTTHSSLEEAKGKLRAAAIEHVAPKPPAAPPSPVAAASTPPAGAARASIVSLKGGKRPPSGGSKPTSPAAGARRKSVSGSGARKSLSSASKDAPPPSMSAPPPEPKPTVPPAVCSPDTLARIREAVATGRAQLLAAPPRPAIIGASSVVPPAVAVHRKLQLLQRTDWGSGALAAEQRIAASGGIETANAVSIASEGDESPRSRFPALNPPLLEPLQLTVPLAVAMLEWFDLFDWSGCGAVSVQQLVEASVGGPHTGRALVCGDWRIDLDELLEYKQSGIAFRHQQDPLTARAPTPFGNNTARLLAISNSSQGAGGSPPPSPGVAARRKTLMQVVPATLVVTAEDIFRYLFLELDAPPQHADALVGGSPGSADHLDLVGPSPASVGTEAPTVVTTATPPLDAADAASYMVPPTPDEELHQPGTRLRAGALAAIVEEATRQHSAAATARADDAKRNNEAYKGALKAFVTRPPTDAGAGAVQASLDVISKAAVDHTQRVAAEAAKDVERREALAKKRAIIASLAFTGGSPSRPATAPDAAPDAEPIAVPVPLTSLSVPASVAACFADVVPANPAGDLDACVFDIPTTIASPEGGAEKDGSADATTPEGLPPIGTILLQQAHHDELRAAAQAYRAHRLAVVAAYKEGCRREAVARAMRAQLRFVQRAKAEHVPSTVTTAIASPPVPVNICGLQMHASVVDLSSFARRRDRRPHMRALLAALDHSGIPARFLVRDITLHAQVPVPGALSGSAAAQRGYVHCAPIRVFRDFAFCPPRPPQGRPWPAGSKQKIQVVTSIPVKSGVRYRFELEGFNFGVGAPIHTIIVGAAHTRFSTVGDLEYYGWPDRWDEHTVLRKSGGIETVEQYISVERHVVCFELAARSFMHVGFSVSASMLCHGDGGNHAPAVTILHQEQRA